MTDISAMGPKELSSLIVQELNWFTKVFGISSRVILHMLLFSFWSWDTTALP